MPATITWNQTTEQEGLGEATVTFTDDSANVISAFTQRVDTRDGGSIQDFIDAAVGHLTKQATKAAARPAVLDKIQSILDEKTSEIADAIAIVPTKL